jgi:hypothetical protein
MLDCPAAVEVRGRPENDMSCDVFVVAAVSLTGVILRETNGNVLPMWYLLGRREPAMSQSSLLDGGISFVVKSSSVCDLPLMMDRASRICSEMAEIRVG